MKRIPLVLLAGVALVACQNEPPRDDAGVIEETGELSVFAFQVGDCFNDPDTAGNVADVTAVPCEEAHDNEVYHLFDMADGDYPGEEGVNAAAEEGCLPAFDAYVGRAYEESDLYVYPITPSADSWDGGDREVVCALYADGEQLTGSMEGSGR